MSADVDLIVMAVTRLSTGVCVACVDAGRQWVRPTHEEPSGWRQLNVEDLTESAGRAVVEVGNQVRWTLGRSIPRPPHVEDREATRLRPALVRTMEWSSFLRICEELAASSLSAFLEQRDRSLIVLRPATVDSILFHASDTDGLSARLRFRDTDGFHDFSVTDLAWRALGRRMLADSGRSRLDQPYQAARHRTGLEVRYLIIGLGQVYQGTHWPFVIGVVTSPRNDEPIDYTNR